MKKIYTTSLFLLGIITIGNSQTPCDLGRYSTEVFPVVDVTSTVQFGQNTNFVGSNVILNMDIYQPNGDTELERPLIVWAHGGSFIGGTRTDSDIVTLANEFTKRGYVCASIDYRTGMWPIDSVNAVKAVVRAVQDMKAAVRFFYMDKATTDTYKIDTTRIFIGGSSAGAVTSLHYAYLNQDCEIENYISPAALVALGGVEGTSGNPGYSTTIQGVVNLAGALASYGWIEAGDVPFCSLHGTNDGTVPYNRGVASVSGFDVITMDGSRVLYEQATVLGIQNNFYSHYGAGHAPYIGSAAYMDTTVNFVSDFLVDLLGCSTPILQPANAPAQTVTLYTLDYCGLGMEELALQLELAPNPSENTMTLSLDENAPFTATVVDLTGRTISTYSGNTSITISKAEIGEGTFLLLIETNDGHTATERIQFM